MAGTTTIKINVVFDKRVPLTPVPSSKLQKQKKNAQKTKKVLGSTKPSAAVETPVLHWDQVTDPIAKTVQLAIKEVTATVTFSTRIWVDKAIAKKDPCYAHVLDHEKRHVKVWQAGAKKYGAKINQEVAAVVAPTLKNPVEVPLSQAQTVRNDAFKVIDAALAAAVQKYGKKIGDESKKKVHTAAELKKTNTICAAYLI